MTGPVHPFVGQGFTPERSIRYWDDIADRYSGLQQGTMPRDIVDYLADEGIVSGGIDAIELGSGPGTYSLLIAPKVASLTCVDTSPRMLRRLADSAEALGIRNIRTVNSDFISLPEEERYGAVVSALCPGTGSRESIEKMESLSERYCAHIMWIENHWDDIHARMWKELGKDYSFSARKDSIVSSTLVGMDRVHEIREFTSEVSFEMPEELAVEREVRSFDAYDLDIDVTPAVREVIGSMSESGTFRYDRTNSMRLIIWEAPRC